MVLFPPILTESSEAPSSSKAVGNSEWKVFLLRFQALSLWIAALSLKILFSQIFWWPQLVSARKSKPFIFHFMNFIKSVIIFHQQMKVYRDWEEWEMRRRKQISCRNVSIWYDEYVVWWFQGPAVSVDNSQPYGARWDSSQSTEGVSACDGRMPLNHLLQILGVWGHPHWL